MRFVSSIMILLFVGCGGGSDRPKLAPVAGVVMKAGKPLADVIVTFHLEGDAAPRLAMGKTDSAGKFRLTSYDTNDGAMIGTHVVTVVKVEAKDQGGEMEIGGDAYDAAMSAAARFVMGQPTPNSARSKLARTPQ